MPEYISYDNYKVVTKTESREFHDRKCPKIISIGYNDRDYLPIGDIVDAKPCQHCCNAKFYFLTKTNGTTVDSMLKKHHLSLEFNKQNDVLIKVGDLWWRISYDCATNHLKAYNGNAKNNCRRFQYSCKCDVKRILTYICKFKSKHAATNSRKQEMARLDSLFAQIEKERSVKMARSI